MICPFCKTENRDERATCYHCEADLKMLRSVVNASRHHYNKALEHAGRGRNKEAITELHTALGLDASFVNGWVVLGTLHAKEERFDEAEKAWERALKLDDRYKKAHDYIAKIERLRPILPAYLRLRRFAMGLMGLIAAMLAGAIFLLFSPWMTSRYHALADWVGEGKSGLALALGIVALPLIAVLLLRLFSASGATISEAREVLRHPDKQEKNSKP